LLILLLLLAVDDVEVITPLETDGRISSEFSEINKLLLLF